jgi:hypothetical protein
MQRIIRTLAAASIVLFGLGACESGGEIAAKYGFTGADAGPATGAFATAVDSSKLIYVVPVEGLSGPARMVLADAIAASLRDAKQPAILTKKNQRRKKSTTKWGRLSPGASSRPMNAAPSSG